MGESNTIVSAIHCICTYNSTALTHPFTFRHFTRLKTITSYTIPSNDQCNVILNHKQASKKSGVTMVSSESTRMQQLRKSIVCQTALVTKLTRMLLECFVKQTMIICPGLVSFLDKLRAPFGIGVLIR